MTARRDRVQSPETAKGHQQQLVTLLATHLVLTKESALADYSKTLKEVRQMADKLPATRFYALVAVLALFGLAPVLFGLAKLLEALR